LEGLSQAIFGLVSDPAVPCDLGAGENQISSGRPRTGNRIKYCKIDAVTGEPVDDKDIVKAYEVGKGRYVEITDDELEAVAIGSTPIRAEERDRRALLEGSLLYRPGGRGRPASLRGNP
jgi:hypothetical protein